MIIGLGRPAAIQWAIQQDIIIKQCLKQAQQQQQQQQQPIVKIHANHDCFLW
jgi:hypothetical protein